MTTTATRTRQHSWTDPTAWLPRLATMSGRELLQDMIDGRLPGPPIAATLGFDSVAIDGDAFVVTLTPQEFHYNPIGSVHGGVLATLLDTAAGCAVHLSLPAGIGYTSLDLSTRFIRPVRAGEGAVRCEGRLLHSGSRTATAEARLTDASGRLVAHATSTCLLFPLNGTA